MLGSAGRRGGSELSHSSCSDVVLFFHCCWANCSASTVARACSGWTLPLHFSLMCLGEYPFLVFLTGAHCSLAVPVAPCWNASSSQIFLSFLACFCNCFCRSSACWNCLLCLAAFWSSISLRVLLDIHGFFAFGGICGKASLAASFIACVIGSV